MATFHFGPQRHGLCHDGSHTGQEVEAFSSNGFFGGRLQLEVMGTDFRVRKSWIWLTP